MEVLSRVHATLQPAMSVGWSFCPLVGKKVEVSLPLFDIFQRCFQCPEMFSMFSISYEQVEALIRLIGVSNEVYRVSKFDYILSFGFKQNVLGKNVYDLWFMIFIKDFFMKNSSWFSFNFLWFCVGSIKKCIDVCLSMQIQENMFLSVAAHC